MTHAHLQLRFLRHVAMISVIAAAITVLLVNRVTMAGPVTAQRWQVGLLTLPWLVFFAAFLPLLHHSWFVRERKSFIVAVALRVFYWFMVALTITIFIGIYAAFVFASSRGA